MPHRPLALVASLVTAGTILAGVLVLDHVEVAHHEELARTQTLQHLTQWRARLSASLETHVNLLHTLAAFARHGSVNQKEFAFFAKQTILRFPSVRTMLVAPDGEVNLIYPPDGSDYYPKADLLTDPELRTLSISAIQDYRTTLNGPTKLRYGDEVLVGRLAIFDPRNNDPTAENQFWGFAIILLDWPEIIKNAGLTPWTGEGERIAIRAKGKSGSLGTVIYGDPKVFSNTPEIIDHPWPTGGWEIAAMPEKGWPVTWPQQDALQQMGGILAASMGLLIFLLTHRFGPRAERKTDLEVTLPPGIISAQLAPTPQEPPQPTATETTSNLDDWFLRKAQEMAGLGCWQWELASGKIAWSPTLFQLLGLAPEQGPPSAHLFFKHMAPDERRRVVSLLRQSLRDKSAFHFEFCIHLPDGTERTLACHGETMVNLVGTLTHLVGTLQDSSEPSASKFRLARDALELRVKERTRELAAAVSEIVKAAAERDMAERALTQSETRFQAIVEDQTELICRLTPDGTLTFINTAYRKFFALPQERFGRATPPLLPQVAREDFLRQAATLTPQQPVTVCERSYTDRQGRVRWVQWTLRLIPHLQEATVEYQAVGHDITVMKETTLAIEQARERMEAHVQERTQELRVANIALLQQIEERQRAEEELHKSNALFAAFIQSTPDVVYFKDAQGRHRIVNSEFEKLINLSNAEIIGKTNQELYPPDLAVFADASDQQVFMLTEGIPIKQQSRATTASGEVRYFETIKTPVFDDQRQIIGLAGISRDVSERVRNDDLLQHRLALAKAIGYVSRSLLSTNWTNFGLILEVLAQAVQTQNAVIFQYQEQSARFEVMSAWRSPERPAPQGAPQSVARKTLPWLMAKLGKEQNVVIRDVLELPGYADAEKAFLKEQGIRSAVLLPIQLANGAMWGFLLISDALRSRRWLQEDVDALRVAAEMLAVYWERILTEGEKLRMQEYSLRNARLASIGVLATSVAHEINNPNSAIHYNATLTQQVWNDLLPILDEYQTQEGEFMLAGAPFEQLRGQMPRVLSGILNNSERIKKIVLNLKRMARDDAGGIKESVNLAAVLRECVAMLQNQIMQFTDHFVANLNDELPQVHGNAQQLEQVFINLILNALHALPNRTYGVHVTMAVAANGDKMLVTIQDEGVGIPAEHLSRLVEPFFTTRGKEGGIGLGLSISNSIVKSHQGQLLFDSSPGVGTMASVELPIKPHPEQG